MRTAFTQPARIVSKTWGFTGWRIFYTFMAIAHAVVLNYYSYVTDGNWFSYLFNTAMSIIWPLIDLGGILLVLGILVTKIIH